MDENTRMLIHKEIKEQAHAAGFTLIQSPDRYRRYSPALYGITLLNMGVFEVFVKDLKIEFVVIGRRPTQIIDIQDPNSLDKSKEIIEEIYHNAYSNYIVNQ